MKNKENDYHKSIVNFDKTKWSIPSQESFNGLKGILKTLFRITDEKTEKQSLSGHRKVRTYKNQIGLVTTYYSPRDSFQPEARIVWNSEENNRLSFFKTIKEELQEDNVTVEISKNGTSLNIFLPEDINNLDSISGLDMDSNEIFKKIFKERMEVSKRSKDLLQKLDIVLARLGYEFQKDDSVKSRDPKYGFVTILETEWFRIYIRHSPVNQKCPFATFQVDGFKKENQKYSYWVLLFILRILKAYKVPDLEGSYEYPILPSQVELAFDFYGYQPDFLFELTSSINCMKQTCGWTDKSNLPLNSYAVEDDKDLLLRSSHYIGEGKDRDYQIAIYNKPKVAPKFTRLEFRLKNKVLKPKKSGPKKLRIDCVDDLFMRSWALDFLKKIQFRKPNQKAFERIDSSYHPLADVSLKAFRSKVPTDKQNNFTRECLDPNVELKESLEVTANEFHKWLKDLYLNSSIMVIPKDVINEDIFQDFYDGESVIPEKYPVPQDIDLKDLFRRLPADTSVTTQEHDSFIRFTICDNQNNPLTHIIIGELPERFLESGDIYFIEKFSDVFSKSENQTDANR